MKIISKLFQTYKVLKQFKPYRSQVQVKQLFLAFLGSNNGERNTLSLSQIQASYKLPFPLFLTKTTKTLTKNSSHESKFLSKSKYPYKQSTQQQEYRTAILIGNIFLKVKAYLKKFSEPFTLKLRFKITFSKDGKFSIRFFTLYFLSDGKFGLGIFTNTSGSK